MACCVKQGADSTPYAQKKAVPARTPPQARKEDCAAGWARYTGARSILRLRYIYLDIAQRQVRPGLNVADRTDFGNAGKKAAGRPPGFDYLGSTMRPAKSSSSRATLAVALASMRW